MKTKEEAQNENSDNKRRVVNPGSLSNPIKPERKELNMFAKWRAQGQSQRARNCLRKKNIKKFRDLRIWVGLIKEGTGSSLILRPAV